MWLGKCWNFLVFVSLIFTNILENIKKAFFSFKKKIFIIIIYCLFCFFINFFFRFRFPCWWFKGNEKTFQDARFIPPYIYIKKKEKLRKERKNIYTRCRLNSTNTGTYFCYTMREKRQRQVYPFLTKKTEQWMFCHQRWCLNWPGDLKMVILVGDSYKSKKRNRGSFFWFFLQDPRLVKNDYKKKKNSSCLNNFCLPHGK